MFTLTFAALQIDFRRRAVRSRVIDGSADPNQAVGDDPTAPGRPDPVEVKRRLACYAAEVASGNISARQAQIFEHVALDVPQEEIAELLHVSYKSRAASLPRQARLNAWAIRRSDARPMTISSPFPATWWPRSSTVSW